VFRFTFLLLALACLAPAEVRFNRDIRPIMSDTCFRCHGPDKNVRMAGLRLDIREEALKPTHSGLAAIVPGHPEQSAIVQRIFDAGARVMPPPYAHKELTPAQKELIRSWVAEGATYEGHWAYQPVARPPVPEASTSNPIDAFIQSRLLREGLQPSPEAGRRTLLRRVTLDLTGIPPAPAELDAFLADSSPDAYEKLVDRLLASPRYAEMRAMHWLDAVRYADTCGFHGDNAFPAWPYRDYVLRAFRDDKPFDVFTREQLAGDLLPEATLEQKIASAYNRLNRTSAEGGLQPKEYLAKYAADRVRTASAVWLGSTLGCAECHDHKFDPFTSRDFYSLKAFFADIQETGLVPDRGPKAWGSQLALPTEEQRQEREDLERRIASLREDLDRETEALVPVQAAWEKDVLRRWTSGELGWRFQRPLTAASANGAKLTIFNEQLVERSYQVDATLVSDRKPGEGLIVASGPNPDNETYTVTFRPGEGTWTALGIEVAQDENLPGGRYARGGEHLVLTEVEAGLSRDGREQPGKLSFRQALANLAIPAPDFPALAAIDGDPHTGWGTVNSSDGANLYLALQFSEVLRTGAGSVVTVRLRHDSDTIRRGVIGRFRVALAPTEFFSPDPEKLAKALRAADRSEEQQTFILEHFQRDMPALAPRALELAQLETRLGLLDARIPRIVVTESAEPEVTRILPRGNWMDDTGAIVEPAVPAFLGKLDTGGQRATRLDLANWIVSPGNPLTARVFVNRLWREFFGIGLSKSLDDLGSQGEWPTHPELLDWLASEFMHPEYDAAGARDWDIRHMVRTIVLSRTYRQSSMSSPLLDERDPDNRLLARQSRYRVDAEVVRDIALSVSGLLAERFGGPSVRPYQPDGYLAALNFPKREYSASRGEDLYRRGLYTFWQRTFLHPSLAAFDAPTREECAVNRVNSNTPLQALVLLNDPTYVEAARAFAGHILSHGGKSLDSRIDWAFLRSVNRKPAPDERSTLAGLYRKSLARFNAAPGDAATFIHTGESALPPQTRPAELAAMTTVARAILNMHETITRN
jgi:hypothetical protein